MITLEIRYLLKSWKEWEILEPEWLKYPRQFKLQLFWEISRSTFTRNASDLNKYLHRLV